MNKRLHNIALIVAMVFLFGVAPPVEAGSGSKIVAKSATKQILQRVVGVRQKLGPLHRFRKPQVLIRWSNSPHLDKARGLPTKKYKSPHVFTQYPRPGRKPSPVTAQRNLNIPHKVTYWEKIRVAPGTRYHMRPVLGGKRGSKEVILHGHVPSRSVKCGNC